MRITHSWRRRDLRAPHLPRHPDSPSYSLTWCLPHKGGGGERGVEFSVFRGNSEFGDGSATWPVSHVNCRPNSHGLSPFLRASGRPSAAPRLLQGRSPPPP